LGVSFLIFIFLWGEHVFPVLAGTFQRSGSIFLAFEAGLRAGLSIKELFFQLFGFFRMGGRDILFFKWIGERVVELGLSGFLVKLVLLCSESAFLGE